MLKDNRKYFLMSKISKYFYKYIPEEVECVYESALEEFQKILCLMKDYETHLESYNSYESLKQEFFDNLSKLRYEGRKIATVLGTVDGFDIHNLKEYEGEISKVSTDAINSLRIKLMSNINFLALSEKGGCMESELRLIQEKTKKLKAMVPSLISVSEQVYTGFIATDIGFYDVENFKGYSTEEKWLLGTLVRTFVDFKLEVYKNFKRVIPKVLEELNNGNISTYSKLFTNDKMPTISLRIFFMNQRLDEIFCKVVNLLSNKSPKEVKRNFNHTENDTTTLIKIYINQLKILTNYLKTGIFRIDNNVEWCDIPDENIAYLQRVLESQEFIGNEDAKKLEKRFN